MNSQNRVGVYFRTRNDAEGRALFAHLSAFEDEIRAEVGDNVIWSWENSGDFGMRMPCPDVFDPAYREDIKAFFQYWLNEFVNVMRPRLRGVGGRNSK